MPEFQMWQALEIAHSLPAVNTNEPYRRDSWGRSGPVWKSDGQGWLLLGQVSDMAFVGIKYRSKSIHNSAPGNCLVPPCRLKLTGGSS